MWNFLISFSSVSWVLPKTTHLFPAICSSIPFQKYFSKISGDQKYNLHLITMKTLFHLLSLTSGSCDNFYFTFRKGQPSLQALVCINLRTWKRVCLGLLVNFLYQGFSHLAEKNIYKIENYTCHLSLNSISFYN